MKKFIYLVFLALLLFCSVQLSFATSHKQAVPTVQSQNVIQYDKNAKRIVLSDTVANLPAGAFEDMTQLESVYIPSSIKVIPDHAFSGCTALKKIVLPDTLEKIGKSAFSGCMSLTKINLPKSLRYIGPTAFARTAIRKLKIPSQCIFENLSLSNCPKLEIVRFDDRESLLLEDWMFYSCPSLKTVVLPKTVDGILLHAYCFSDCVQLSKIKNLDRISSIGAKAFENCKNLSSFTVSPQIIRIDRYAFLGCDSLKKLRVLSMNPDFLTATKKSAAFLQPLPDTCKVYVKTAAMKRAVVDAGFTGKVIVKADLK